MPSSWQDYLPKCPQLRYLPLKRKRLAPPDLLKRMSIKLARLVKPLLRRVVRLLIIRLLVKRIAIHPIQKTRINPIHQQFNLLQPSQAKPPSFSSHRHAVNPNLAVGVLREVETVIMEWQLTLEQTILEIQALYLEGPIVDGWLESHPVGSPQVTQPVGAAALRHAEIDRLMDYVEEICRAPQTAPQTESPRTGYRLCGLDADGQLWSRPCPAQQVPYVGLAIARYQKLRLLLARKQNLENRLNQLIQTLTLLHGQIREPIERLG
jgi:hypothetical protein